MDTLNVNRKKAVAYFGYVVFNEFGTNVILVTTLFYGGHLVIAKRLTVDALFSFLLYQMQLGENITNIGWVFTSLMESIGASRKVFEYIQREPRIAYDGTQKPSQTNGKINFDSVTFSYPSRAGTTVLDVSASSHTTPTSDFFSGHNLPCEPE